MFHLKINKTVFMIYFRIPTNNGIFHVEVDFVNVREMIIKVLISTACNFILESSGYEQFTKLIAYQSLNGLQVGYLRDI